MVTKQQAEEYLKTKLARNLRIYDSWESEEYYIFALACVDEYDQIKPLFGDSTVKIGKESGEIEWETNS